MGRTALVVDDDLLARHLISAVLEEDGWTVVQASDGSEGLREAQSRRPDVVLLDVMMPGLDGHEVCRRLKEDPATSGIAVVFVTASSETRRTPQTAGVEYLRKPFRPDTLARTIHAAMTHSTVAQSPALE